MYQLRIPKPALNRGAVIGLAHLQYCAILTSSGTREYACLLSDSADWWAQAAGLQHLPNHERWFAKAP